MPWSLVDSWTHSVDVTEKAFIGLAGLDDALILIRGVSASVSSQRSLQVSIDNGSNYLSTSGDYVTIDGTGVATNVTNVGFHQTSATAARSGLIMVQAFSLATDKVVDRMSRVDVRQAIIPTANALNAVRVNNSAGGNLTAGSIWLLGRIGAFQWEHIESRTVTLATEDFTGLSGYNDIRILLDGVTASAAGNRRVVVSTDNGSTFLTTSGDYVNIASDGQESNQTQATFHITGSASARGGDISIIGFNLTGSPKLLQRRNRIDVHTSVIPTTTALNALQIGDSSGNLTGGTIHLYGRP